MSVGSLSFYSILEVLQYNSQPFSVKICFRQFNYLSAFSVLLSKVFLHYFLSVDVMVM